MPKGVIWAGVSAGSNQLGEADFVESFSDHLVDFLSRVFLAEIPGQNVMVNCFTEPVQPTNGQTSPHPQSVFELWL